MLHGSEMEGGHKILLGKPEGKRLPDRPKIRREDNIIRDFKEEVMRVIGKHLPRIR